MLSEVCMEKLVEGWLGLVSVRDFPSVITGLLVVSTVDSCMKRSMDDMTRW